MSGDTRISCSVSRSWRSGPRRLLRWIEGPLALLYAPHCLLCGRSLDSLSPVCAMCAHALPRLQGPRCLICQQPLPEAGLDLCVRCGTHHREFARAVPLGPYEGGWRRLILDLKAGRDRVVSRFLSSQLAEEVRRQPSRVPDIITFVPMTARERRSRGFNQSRLLATGVARQCRIPVARLLTKRIDTRRQSVLGAEQRRANLRDAFSAVRSQRNLFRAVRSQRGLSHAVRSQRGLHAVRSSTELSSKSVLLIDDVLTTGATAEACSRALLDAGYGEVVVLVVARAEGSGISR